MDGGAYDCISSPPASPKPKPKSKAAAKPKSILPERVAPTEKPKTAAMKTRAKAQTGTRTRAAVTKSKDHGDTKVVKKGPPQKAKAKAKRKSEIVSADEEGKNGGEERGKLELAKNSPAVIEVLSSPPEPPKAILPKRKPISRVISKEVFLFNSLRCVHASLRSANRSYQERVENEQPKTEEPTRVRPASEKVALPQGENDSRVEEVTLEPVKVISVPIPPPVRLVLAEKRAEIPMKPISEREFAMNVLQEQDDHTTNPAEAGRLPVAGLRASNGSLLAVANPPAAVSGGVSHDLEVEVGVEKEAVATDVQVCHIDDNTPRFPLTRNFHQGFTRHGRRTPRI